MFNFNNTTTDEALDLIKRVSLFYNDDKKRLFKIDISELPNEKDLLEILMNALARNLLNSAKNKLFTQLPLIMILDEAHIYLNKKIRDEYSIEVELDSFDRIAKECRKY